MATLDYVATNAAIEPQSKVGRGKTSQIQSDTVKYSQIQSDKAPRSSYVGFPVNIPPNRSEKC